MPATATPSARDRLLSAALARFGQDGLVAVNLDDVRRDAGVSVGALYHHFEDKRALADALFVELSSEYQDGFLEVLRVHPGAREGIEAAVRYHLGWVTRHRSQARILLGERPDTAELRDRNHAFFAAVLAWWRPHVHYRALRALPLDLIHALWLGPAQEYSRLWLAAHARRTPTHIADTLAGAAWNALKEDQS